MNTIDIIILVIVLFGLARGFQKGLVHAFVGLIGWLVALIAGSMFASVAAPFFASWVDSEPLKIALGFLSIVLLVLTLLQLVSVMLEKILAGLNLKILDRMAGGVFGAAKSVLIVLIILSSTAPVLQRISVWQNSVIVPELLPFAPVAMEFSKKMMKDTVPNMLPEALKQKQEHDANQTANSAVTETVTNESSVSNTASAKEDIALDQIRVVE